MCLGEVNSPAKVDQAPAEKPTESSKPPKPTKVAPESKAAKAIPYSSPEEALESLSSKPGVSIREENDWYIANDSNENTIWSITQKTNPAYPAIVKRTLVEENGAINLKMKVDCGATREICDKMVQAFVELNAQVQQKMQELGTKK
jgi:hypothetical protein